MKFLVLSVCFLTFYVSLAQQRVELIINSIPPNEPKFELELSIFSGQSFHIVSKQKVESTDTIVYLSLDLQEDTNVRLYQIKVLGSPNTAEFLSSPKEKIKISTPLYDLLNGKISIENSQENLAYSRLLRVLNEFSEISEAIDRESGTYSVYDHDFNAKVNELSQLVEEVQHKLNLNLEKIEISFPDTYVAQVLVPISKIPVRHYKNEWSSYYDGYLSFLHDFFFYFVNVSDTRILLHYAFQDKLFEYLNDYVSKDQSSTEKAIDALMLAFSDNSIVKSFVYNQLMQTYIQLDSEYFVNYLIENYGDGCGLNLSFEELKKMEQITATNIGNIAPDILLYDLNNKANSLKNVVGTTEYTVVLFWVGWCEHCKKEMPDLINIALDYKKKVSFFAVSLDADDKSWKDGTSNYSFPKNWVNVCEKVPIEKSTFAPLYNVSTTPTVLLLDKEGKIIAKSLKSADLIEILEKID